MARDIFVAIMTVIAVTGGIIALWMENHGTNETPSENETAASEESNKNKKENKK